MTITPELAFEAALGLAALAVGVARLFVTRANEDLEAARLTPQTEDDETAQRHLASATLWQGRAMLLLDVLTLGSASAALRSILGARRVSTSAQGPTPHYEAIAGRDAEETAR